MNAKERSTKNIVQNVVNDGNKRLDAAAAKLGLPMDGSGPAPDSKIAPWRDEEERETMCAEYEAMVARYIFFGWELRRLSKFHPTPAQRAVRQLMQEQQAQPSD